MKEVIIKRLKKYTPEAAAGIGALMPSLSDKFDGSPVDEACLREIIESPHHEQFVAIMDNKIVGTATLSILLSPEPLRNAYLESIVVDSGIQGAGIGSKIWNDMVKWCQEKHCARLEFTSSDKRTGAIAFYLKKGCTIYDTNFFRYEIPKAN